MTSEEIFEQLATCDNLRQSDIDALLSRGVPITALHHPICLSRSPVTFDGHRFEFDVAGTPAIIVPAIEFGQLVDLVGWLPQSHRMASWLGRCAALGMDDELYAPFIADEPLQVWADCLGWLRVGRTGIVPIDLARTASRVFMAGDHVRGFICENPEHGQAILGAFDRRPPLVLTPKHSEAA